MPLPDLAARLAKAVGHRIPIDIAPHYEYATADTIRLFARSYGDDDPRFTEVAPPLFPLASGSSTGAPVDDAVAALWRELRATSPQITEDRWTFGPPVPLGTRLLRDDMIAAVSSDPVLNVTVRSRYFTAECTHAVHERDRSYQPHTARPARGKASYTQDEIAAIEGQYGAHRAHRSEASDRLGPLVKGPLTITDLVAYRAGVGPGPFGVEALELNVASRRRRPHFFDRDDAGMWDARERLHYDNSYAQSQGHPNAYDYSHTRLVWASQLITGWLDQERQRLAALTFRELAPNYVGDTTWLTGTVTSRAGAQIAIEYQARNQLGAITARGEATVAPS